MGITETQAELARARLAARAAKLKAKRETRAEAERAAPKKRAAPPPPSASPVETKRLSIEGLREAGRHRAAAHA